MLLCLFLDERRFILLTAKKRIVIITGILSSVSLIIFILSIMGSIRLSFPYTVLDPIYDISLTLFGSSLLGFIMSLVEYFSERKKAMEEFWQEANHILNQYRKIRPVMHSFPREMFFSYYKEKEDNYEIDKIIRRFRSNLFGQEKDFHAQNELYEWAKNNSSVHICPDLPEDIISLKEHEYFDKCVEQEKERYEKAFDEYILLANINTERLGNMYANLDFLVGNRWIRSNAWEKVYSPITKIATTIYEQSAHFQFYKDGNGDGNFIACSEKVDEIEKIIFETVENEYYGKMYLSYFHKYLDDIEDALQDFLSYLYKSAKKEKSEKVLVMYIRKIE